MKIYTIQYKEAGNKISEHTNEREAYTTLKVYVDQDILNDIFVPDFYEIKEVEITVLTEKQKTSLQEIIFQKLIESDEIGLGEIGECRDEAERIADQWANDNGIVFID
jgi:hypothetical protein